MTEDRDPRSGVVRHAQDLTCPGYRFYVVPTLSRAELIDASGAVIHMWTHAPSAIWEHAELIDDGDLLVIGATPSGSGEVGGVPRIPDSTRYVARIDRDSSPRWKRKMNAHHDAALLPEERVAVLTFERRRIPGIHPDIDTRDDGIAILDAGTGELLESWGFLDAVAGHEDIFPPQLGNINDLGGEKWVDLFHANSIEWLESAASFGLVNRPPSRFAFVTFRHQDRIALFDVDRREVVWAWGRDILDGAHDAQLLASGRVLLFDNGLVRGWSRAVEVNPAVPAVTWEWRAEPPPGFYSASKGSVQRLPNGNTLLAESDAGRAVEITPRGEIVWELLSPYRTPEGGRAAFGKVRWVDRGEHGPGGGE
ncbi:MAG: arylsulfotransferase family protein [Candidatus Eiseniibacteriota bacterium]